MMSGILALALDSPRRTSQIVVLLVPGPGLDMRVLLGGGGWGNPHSTFPTCLHLHCPYGSNWVYDDKGLLGFLLWLRGGRQR